MAENSGKKFLVTSALPYANGPLHFGHIAGVYLPADIYTRHRKLQGHRVIHISGSDEHGVAIMLNAEKEKKDYRQYVDRWHAEHRNLFSKLNIQFEFFGRTSDPYHKEEVLRWFHRLYDQGFIGEKSEKQLYCEKDQMFLPDRYVEGVCYICGYSNARGDECPNCGEWIDSTKLKDPVCKICSGRQIVTKETEHYYLMLTKMEKQFRNWFSGKKDYWRRLVTGFVTGLLEKGLIDRAISRDLAWGIDVPLEEAKGKKLYVWFDAPIGYVSNTKKYLEDQKSKEDYIKDWWNGENVEISHFIGKDNIIFHALIWPCMSMGTGFVKTPTEIPANEFLNLEGKQFSKSAGWYVDAEKSLEDFGEDALRFYLCSVIPETSDTSFSWDQFSISNAEFGNKIGNFVHRVLSFMAKNWPEGVSPKAFEDLRERKAFQIASSHFRQYTKYLDRFQFTKAHTELLLMGQQANEFFHAEQPWKVIKEDKNKAEEIIASSLVYILFLGIALQPIVPKAAERLLQSLSCDDLEIRKAIYNGKSDSILQFFKDGFKLQRKPEVLVPRIDPDLIDRWREELQKK